MLREMRLKARESDMPHEGTAMQGLATGGGTRCVLIRTLDEPV